MSSVFDKGQDPERRPDGDDGREDTRAYGQSVPPPPDPGAQPYGYGPPPGGPGYPPSYGPPSGYGPGYGFAVPDHPKATTSMVLGILGVVLCQVVAPFAWVTGKRTLNEIDASGGRWGGRGQAQTGYVLGIVGSVLLGLSLAFLLVYLVVAFIAFAGVAAGV